MACRQVLADAEIYALDPKEYLMRARRLTPEQECQRLIDYLKSISPQGELESSKELLESFSGESEQSSEELDVLRSGEESQSDETTAGLETLDLLISDGINANVSADDLGSLEAIIHKKFRPAIFIIGNDFTAPKGKWSFLDKGDVHSTIKSAIPSVGCIEVPNDPRGRPYGGSAFVVGENLLMTNRHVAEIFASGVGDQELLFRRGQIAEIDFKREVKIDSRQSQPDPIYLEVKLKMIHPYWDMALLEVKNGLPADQKILELSILPPEKLFNHDVVVIGYPAQDARNDINLQNSIFGGIYEVKRLLPGKYTGYGKTESFGERVDAATHDCSTLGGNSGSVVLDLCSGNVVGLHFAGEYLKANYAVSTFDLGADSRVVDAGVRFAGEPQLDRDRYGKIWDKIDTKFRGSSIPASPSPSNQTLKPKAVSTDDGPTLPSVAEGLFYSRQTTPSSTFYDRFSISSLTERKFDWQLALSMALASAVSYENESLINDIVRSRWRLDFVKFISNDETQCFIAAIGHAVVVAFRGTESRGDWLGNLNAIHTTRPYGAVHRGFLGAFQVVDELLRDELSKIGGKSVVLTGHSLGGALATVASAEWHGIIPVSSIYTYGQPAVGRGKFLNFMKEKYHDRFFRIVNDNDVVTRIPPNFSHIGSKIHFKKNGQLWDAPKLDETLTAEAADPNFLSEAEFDDLRSEVLSLSSKSKTPGRAPLEAPATEGIVPSVRDHGMDEYIAKIAAFASSSSQRVEV